MGVQRGQENMKKSSLNSGTEKQKSHVLDKTDSSKQTPGNI